MNRTFYEAHTPFIPQNVAQLVVREKMPLVKDWRIRLNMNVEEIAASAGLLPDEVIRFEKRETVYSLPLLNVALAMNLDVDQIVDITD